MTESRKPDARNRKSKTEAGQKAAPRGGAAARKKSAARHELSAGGIVYRETGSGKGRLYLLICDSYKNWGFPKGHVEPGEEPDAAALREVGEETGIAHLELRGLVDTIEWFFRFRGRLIHKRCRFYLMETREVRTKPQRAEGITACRWAAYTEAMALLSYANARAVLERANTKHQTPAHSPR